QDRRSARLLRLGAEMQAMRTEAADRDEGIARAHVAAVEHQAGDLQWRPYPDHVGLPLRQWHGAGHGVAPPCGAGTVEATAPGVARPCALARLASSAACAASQVSMSSGGTSISRSAPSITRANSGAEIQPPP